MSFNKNVAIQLVYISRGFFDGVVDPTLYDRYAIHADIHTGDIGIVMDLYSYAEFVETLLLNYSDEQYRGVFQYEVSEQLGLWLFEHPDEFADNGISSAFQEHAQQTIIAWFHPTTSSTSN